MKRKRLFVVKRGVKPGTKFSESHIQRMRKPHRKGWRHSKKTRELISRNMYKRWGYRKILYTFVIYKNHWPENITHVEQLRKKLVRRKLGFTESVERGNKRRNGNTHTNIEVEGE